MNAPAVRLAAAITLLLAAPAFADDVTTQPSPAYASIAQLQQRFADGTLDSRQLTPHSSLTASPGSIGPARPCVQ